jgi:hypothetical protein
MTLSGWERIQFLRRKSCGICYLIPQTNQTSETIGDCPDVCGAREQMRPRLIRLDSKHCFHLCGIM